MKVLLDTDVILDFYLDRTPFSSAAKALWQANQDGKIEGYVSAITPVNLFYIARKIKGATKALEAVKALLLEFKLCPVDEAVLEAATLSEFIDFEDAVQQAAAQNSGITYIVTRNIADYSKATLKVLLPPDFLKLLP